jgi:replicative DNA helicase
MPKRLLRSVIEFDKEITPENLIRNFQRLRKAVDADQLEWGRPEDEQIYKYILGFFIQYFEMPSPQTVLDYFESVNGVEAIERLKDIKAEQSYSRTNFAHLLRSLQENQAVVKGVALLKETHEILVRGVEDKKKQTHKGLEDAIMHFTKRAQEIRVVDTDTRLHGDIRKDGQKMREEYALAESDKSRVYGVLSGINEIDNVCKGLKKGELWIHAAFPSELKTTLAANWSYNAVTRYKKNVVYISFEMPYEQIRRNIYSIHSTNRRFSQKGFKPLDYLAIRDGTLTPEEKDFYDNHVTLDFENNPTYTTFEVMTPDRDWSMDDVRSHVELLHKEFDVGLVVLDHGQWIEARKDRRNKDYTIELNSVIRDAKRFALTFDHNNGVPVLLLFQINRAGKDDADKNDGIYKMKALTYANECEKAADVITTTYLNDTLRMTGATKITNLKNRDNPPFKPFEAIVQFAPRRIVSPERLRAEDPQGFSVEDQHECIDLAQAMAEV